MIDAYAFLFAFALQIVAASILYPARLISYVRGWAQDFGSERFAQVSTEDEHRLRVERFASGYRAAALVTAVLGVVLLGWLFRDIHSPDWIEDAKRASWIYFMLQMAPLILLFLYAGARYKKLNQSVPQGKRRAVLQPRSLFDFISPVVVFLAVLSYLLFIAFAFYVDLHVYKNPSPSRYCYIAIANATFIYAMDAVVIYKYLYGKNNPLVTHEGRLHRIGMMVKSGVYGSIATVWFFGLISVIRALDLSGWEPFALSVFWIVTSLLFLMTLTAPPRKPPAGESGHGSEVLS